MSTLIILKQMVMIAILVAIGFGMFRKKLVDDHTTRGISVIVTDICNPALALSCALQGNIQATKMDILKGLGIAAIIYGLMCLIGVLIPKLLGISKNEQKFYNLMTVYANTGFIGIPVAKAVLSDTAMLYVIIFNVMFSLFFYTHGILVMAEGKGRIQVKNILNPGTVMSTLTILIVSFHITLPIILSSTVIYIGSATTFLSMSLLGISLAKASFREIIGERRLYPYVILRMLVIPILLSLGLKMLHVPRDMVMAFTLMVAMPAANMPLIQAEKIGEDTTVLSRGIVMTTVFSLATITLVMTFV
jgi:predicted permease